MLLVVDYLSYTQELSTSMKTLNYLSSYEIEYLVDAVASLIIQPISRPDYCSNYCSANSEL